jgi:hypothetical protein
LDLKGRKTDHGEMCTMMSFCLYSSPKIVRVIKSRMMRGWDMWHAWGRREVFTRFWLRDPKGRDHWKH